MPAPDPTLSGIALDPAWPKRLYVMGDSVMLSGKYALLHDLPDWQITIAGRPALRISEAVGDIRREKGPLDPVAVIGLGYNSAWQKNRQNFQIWSDQFDKDVEAMLAALKERGVQKTVWVLLRELTPDLLPGNGIATFQYGAYAWYFPYVNERLRAIKRHHPELALADWASAGRQPGVTYDAIHLNTRGAELFVDVLKVAIGIGVPSHEEGALAAAGRPEPGQSSANQQAHTNEHRSSGAPAYARGDTKASPSYAFRDCPTCPELVVIPASTFLMGSPETEQDRDPAEGPQRLVTIARPLAVGRFPVTFDEWGACVAAGGCKDNPNPNDQGSGKGRHPVVNVSWDDAKQYIAWLSQATGKQYRLLSEAEWEYAARAGTTTPYYTGTTITATQADFQTVLKADGTRDGVYREQTVEVGSFAPNPWQLFDMHGNVWEWVEDNWHENYMGAPTDGSAAPGGDPSLRVMRGGSWYSFAPDLRSASRHKDYANYRSADVGFRVARPL